MDTKNVKNGPLDNSFKSLHSSRGGLSRIEAEKRLGSYGYNEINIKNKAGVLIFLSKFLGPVPIMLEITLVIAYILGESVISYIIFVLLVFNAFIGFIEEFHADNAIALLRSKLTIKTMTLRDRIWREIDSKYIVPGDVIHLIYGNIVPADCKITENENLITDDSSLTGESMPVTKICGDICFSGSRVNGGEATALVLSTGKNTYFGKVTELIGNAKTTPKVESAVMNIVKKLMIINIFLIMIVVLYSVFLSEPLNEIIPFALILLIGSVPVALPVAFTASMAIGTEALLKKGILVTKLSAIEEASTVSVLCVDKTGTITENRLSVQEPIAYANFSKEDVIRFALLTSKKEEADPIDAAIIEYAKMHKIKRPKYKIEEFIPFDNKTKRGGAVVKYNNRSVMVVKGAITALIDNINTKEKIKVEKETEELSKKGFRTLAVFIKDEKTIKTIGLIPIYDKPRDNVKELIAELEELGLSTKMLTGDNIHVAREIAHEIGIGGKILEIGALKDKPDATVATLIERAGGFADVLPENKYDIVTTLQNSGLSVGMTGDGVNDAPALEKAQVGIAVSNSTDVAKASASIVLTVPGMGVIIDAIKESRKIFERMITYTVMKIAKMIQIVFFLTIGFMAFKFFPILPFQLILLLFLNDVSSITLSTDNEQYSSRPDTWDVNGIIYASSIIGSMLLIETVFFSVIGLYTLNMNIQEFQTFLFLVFDVSIELAIYSIRERRHFWNSKPSRMLIMATMLGMALGAIIAYLGIFMQAISLYSIIVVFVVAFISFILIDEIKVKLFGRFSEFKNSGLTT